MVVLLLITFYNKQKARIIIGAMITKSGVWFISYGGTGND